MENQAAAKSNGKTVAEKSKFGNSASQEPSSMKEFMKEFMKFFNCCLYAFLFVLISYNLLKYSNAVDCIMDSFQNDSQLHDPVYGAQVTQNCWLYDIHPDNYMRFGSNHSTLYVRKYSKSNSRPIEFYERQREETEFLRMFYYSNALSLFLQLILAIISTKLGEYRILKKTVTILRFVFLLNVFGELKLVTYGQYSSKFGIRFDLWEVFPDNDPEMDSLPANFTKSVFTPQDVKIVNWHLYHSSTVIPAICNGIPVLLGLLVIILLIQLVAMIVWKIVQKIRAAKNPKNSTANCTRSNSGNQHTATKPTSETVKKPISNGSKTTSPSTEDDSVSSSVEGDSAAKEEYVITVGEI